jgi:uncharacterized protein
MSETWPKILRDPVHSLIVFQNNAWDRLILNLLDTPEVQRLRRIKQLGFSELVFPGANHSRLAHSLGVLHVTKKFLDQFDLLAGKPPDEGQRCIVLAAALLHDIGHGPFSHAFEKVTKLKHENFTHQIIADESTQVHQRLRSVDTSLPDRLKRFFSEGKEEGEATQVELPAYLTHVISSQLDADRCDYLLRDSYATGTNYGQYDLDWLLSHLQPQPDGRRFFLSRKALSAAEAYVFARFHMYRTVYFHKTTRAAEVMLRLVFQRLREQSLPDYFFSADSPADTPYKPYDPDAEKPTEQIFVEDAAGKPTEISILSPTVDQLRKRYELVRYYFPARLRNTVREIAKSTL